MNRSWTQALLTVAVLYATIGSTRAAIISRDFRAPGDGLLTYDSVSNREWLDITETDDQPISDVQQSLSGCGALSGFKIATVDDVWSLAESTGYTSAGNTTTGNPYFSIANELINFVGESILLTIEFGTGPTGEWTFPKDILYIRVSDAWAVDNSVPTTLVPEAVAVMWPQQIGIFRDPRQSFVGLLDHPWGVDLAPFRGVWLYRDAAIPEPSTIALLAIIAALSPLRLRAFA